MQRNVREDKGDVFMAANIEAVIEEAGRYANEVRRHLPVEKVYLLGSYAKGVAHSRSDVDILVDSGLRGLRFVGLIELAREALQKNIDMFDVYYVAKGSSVEREIAETGVPIYRE
jgi:predicted nucleotidyltransferase